MSGSSPSRRSIVWKLCAAAGALVVATAVAHAELKPYKDYSISESVWLISTVKVDPNMEDVYLEGLRNTWVAANEVSKKLGHIEEYHIYRSSMAASGDFNLMLVVKYKNTAALGPSQERYEAFVKEWGEARQKQTTEFSQKTYPAMRKITGDYTMREITIK